LAEISVGGKPVKEYFQDAFEFWLSGNLAEKLKGSFDGLTMVFKDGFNALSASMSEWGGGLIDRFAAGFTDRWNSVKTTVGNLIPDSLKQWLQQKSPAELGDLDSEAWGGQVPKLFAQGMEKNSGVAVTAADNMANQIQLPISRANVDSQAMEQSFKNIGSASNSNTVMVRQFGSAISTAFEDAIIKGQSFNQVLQGLEQSLLRIALRLTVTKQIEDMMSSAMGGSGGGGSGGSSGAGGLLSGLGNFFGGSSGGSSSTPITEAAFLAGDKAPIGAAGNHVTVHMNIATPDVNGFVQNQGNILQQMNQAVQRGGRNA
jgi:hypothetical protein